MSSNIGPYQVSGYSTIGPYSKKRVYSTRYGERYLTPTLEAADVINADEGGNSATFTIPYPAYEDGDLIIICNGMDGTGTSTIPLTGPNDEEVVILAKDSSASPSINLLYWVGVGSNAGGNFTITNTTSQFHSWMVIQKLAGTFNATWPVSAYVDDTEGTGASVNSAAIANAGEPFNGVVVNFSIVDVDPITGTPAGWTNAYNTDEGQLTQLCSVRDSIATYGESVAAASWTIASDDWASVTMILNGYDESSAAVQHPIGAYPQVDSQWDIGAWQAWFAALEGVGTRGLSWIHRGFNPHRSASLGGELHE